MSVRVLIPDLHATFAVIRDMEDIPPMDVIRIPWDVARGLRPSVFAEKNSRCFTISVSMQKILADIAKSDEFAALVWPWYLRAFDSHGKHEAKYSEIWSKATPYFRGTERHFTKDHFGLYESHGLVEVSGESPVITVTSWKQLKRKREAFDKNWIKTRQIVFKRDSFQCLYCGILAPLLECDHIIPRSRGGSEDLSNLATACQECNRLKRDRTPEEWER